MDAARRGRWRSLDFAVIASAVAGAGLVAASVVTDRVVRAAPGERSLFALSRERLVAAAPGEPRVILHFGDTGCASPELRRNLSAMEKERADLAIHAGDVSYHGPLEYGRFLAGVERLPFPVFAVPGDHDHDADHALAEYDRVIGGRDRAIDWADLRMVFLDSSRETLSDATLDFLETELAREPAPRWKLVVTHCPPCEPTRRYPEECGVGHCLKGAASVGRFMAALEREKVDLLLCGHVHAFADVRMGATRVVISGGGGRDVDPGQEFHFARITLADPIDVEEVVTSSGHGNSSIGHVGDSIVSFVLRYGRSAGVAALAAAALLLGVRAALRWAIERRPRAA